jgi:peroxiredoxin
LGWVDDSTARIVWAKKNDILRRTLVGPIRASVIAFVILAGGWIPAVSIAANASAQERERARGWLGIVMEEKDGAVRIREVLAGSPAARAGLKAGDALMQVDGGVVRSAREVVQEIGKHAAGSSVRLKTSRAGRDAITRIVLVAAPSGEELLRLQHVGKPAPALTGLRTSMDTDGPTLDALRGKVVVLDFWASWCVACRVTSNHLNGWHDRYKARGLEVLGVAGEPSEQLAQGARRFGIRYATCADPKMETSAAYHVRELPSLVLIDRLGVVRDVATGFDPERMRQMEELMNRLLAEPVPAPRAGR